MPRSPRIWESGELYLLSPKGNDGRKVFLDDSERRAIMARCDEVIPAHGVVVIAFCLMDNHLHFLIRVGEGSPSEAMHVLLGGYACWWNAQHERKGHLFEARFHANPIRGEPHFLSAVRYVDMNPVAAGMRARPEDWEFSSYRAHVGLDRPPAFLANGEFFKYFGQTTQEAIARYKRFVATWIPPDPTGRVRSDQRQFEG